MVMGKDKAPEKALADADDNGSWLSRRFKRLRGKKDTAPHDMKPNIPAASQINKDNLKQVTLDASTVPTEQENPEMKTILDESPESRDKELSPKLRAQKAEADFRNVTDRLEKVLSKSTTQQPIQLNLQQLDRSDIGNVVQMAEEIELSVAEFMKGRNTENEARKGKRTAKNWVHKVSFAGQMVLSTATNVASVCSSVIALILGILPVHGLQCDFLYRWISFDGVRPRYITDE